MKLTREQKQSICAVYERAMTVKEKFSGQPLLIAIDIDGYKTFTITAYDAPKEITNISRLAGDRLDVFDTDRCFRAINEIEAYCDTFLNNKEDAKRARIKSLEKEIARLKED